MFELLSTTLLIAHLWCVNVAAGGPILCVWLEWWRPDAVARRAAAYLGRLSLLSLVAGSLLGVALGWLKWTPEYRELWTGPLSYKLHMGAAELVFSLVLAVIYWLLSRSSAGPSLAGRIGRGTVALLNGSNLLYHFPPLFAVAGKLAEGSLASSDDIRGAEFRSLAWAGDVPSLAIHVMLASVAVAGVMLLGLALRWQRRDESPADIAQVAIWGSRWALGASLVQFPVGLWTLATLPAETQANLMGTQALGTTLFIAALLAVFWLLRDLAGVALGETTRSLMIRSLTAMVVVVGLMTAMQQATRPAPSGSPAASASNQRTVPAPGERRWPPKS